MVDPIQRYPSPNPPIKLTRREIEDLDPLEIVSLVKAVEEFELTHKWYDKATIQQAVAVLGLRKFMLAACFKVFTMRNLSSIRSSYL